MKVRDALHRFERSGLHCGQARLRWVVRSTNFFTASKEAVSIAAVSLSVGRLVAASFTASKEAVSIAALSPWDGISHGTFVLHRFERSGLHCGLRLGPPTRPRRRPLHRFERSGLHCGKPRPHRCYPVTTNASPLRKKRSPLRQRTGHRQHGPHLDFTASKEAVSIAARAWQTLGQRVGPGFTASKEAVSIAALFSSNGCLRPCNSSPLRKKRSPLRRVRERPCCRRRRNRFTASKEAVSIAARCGRTVAGAVVVVASPLRKKRSPLRRDACAVSVRRVSSASPLRKKRSPLRL